MPGEREVIIVISLITHSLLPDLTLSFMNPRLLDDISFHPCVRFKRWEVSDHLCFRGCLNTCCLGRESPFLHPSRWTVQTSFIPDRISTVRNRNMRVLPTQLYSLSLSFPFSLPLTTPLSFSLCLLPPLSPSMVSLPVYVTPQFTFAEGTGKFSIKLGPKQTMGKTVSQTSIIPINIFHSYSHS